RSCTPCMPTPPCRRPSWRRPWTARGFHPTSDLGDAMQGPRILEHKDIAPEDNPTGEALLERSHPPVKTWVPNGNFLVLGHSQTPEKELRLEAAAADD